MFLSRQGHILLIEGIAEDIHLRITDVIEIRVQVLLKVMKSLNKSSVRRKLKKKNVSLEKVGNIVDIVGTIDVVLIISKKRN